MIDYLYLDEFASSPKSVTRRRPGQSIGPNQLVWDLGQEDIYSLEAVQNTIKIMEETFHLVMILENFEVIPSRGSFSTFSARNLSS